MAINMERESTQISVDVSSMSGSISLLYFLVVYMLKALLERSTLDQSQYIHLILLKPKKIMEFFKLDETSLI